MRVTQTMLSNSTLRRISDSYERMQVLQDQLTTGKKITRPSQDPVIAMNGINYRTQVNEIKQFDRNINEVYNWTDNSDDTLDKVTQAIQRVRELTVQAANDSYEGNQRANIATEVKELTFHLEELANTKINGKYIFNGTDTHSATPPVDLANDLTVNNVSTNNNPVNIEVMKGVEIQVNSDPTNLFDTNFFNEFKGIVDDLNSNVDSSVISSHLGSLDNILDKVVSERAVIGARQNRIELIENRLSSREVVATKSMSENEDAQTERVIIDLKSQESVHQAALSAGARIMQPTLIDFLR